MNSGLCDTCLHQKRIVSGRGQIFSLCRLVLHDPRFAKYPPLPVLHCNGFAPRRDSKQPESRPPDDR